MAVCSADGVYLEQLSSIDADCLQTSHACMRAYVHTYECMHLVPNVGVPTFWYRAGKTAIAIDRRRIVTSDSIYFNQKANKTNGNLFLRMSAHILTYRTSEGYKYRDAKKHRQIDACACIFAPRCETEVATSDSWRLKLLMVLCPHLPKLVACTFSNLQLMRW